MFVLCIPAVRAIGTVKVARVEPRLCPVTMGLPPLLANCESAPINAPWSGPLKTS